MPTLQELIRQVKINRETQDQTLQSNIAELSAKTLQRITEEKSCREENQTGSIDLLKETMVRVKKEIENEK